LKNREDQSPESGSGKRAWVLFGMAPTCGRGFAFFECKE
jgi:hypothetical protein